MSTYTKEPGYIYIETEADRNRHSPKRRDDEAHYSSAYRWCSVGDLADAQLADDNGRFSCAFIYRRRIPADLNGWLPATTELPGGVNDDNSWVEALYPCGNRSVYHPSAFEMAGWPGATHYRVIPKVAAPQPDNPADKDAITDAYYAWVSGDDCTSDEPLDAWLAGVVWEREQKANQ